MKQIALDNDWRYHYRARRRNTTTGAWEAAAGLSGLQAWISAEPGGASLNGALAKPLTEYADTDGDYTAVVDGDDLRTHLTAYVGRVVYEVFGDSTNVLTSVARRVVAVRRLG